MDTTFLLNSILKSDGTNQNQRMVSALDPDFIKIDERSLGDLLSFTYGLSKQVNFFDLNNTVNGNWSAFFNYFVDPLTDGISMSDEDILQIIKSKSDFEPQFALFLAFIQLFGFALDDLNSITRSHLDFYYQEVLQLTPGKPVADKVHIILELAKNLVSAKIESGTQFKAAKEATGVPLYASDNEVVINKAQIDTIKSVYLEDLPQKYSTIYSSEAANSADGKGKAFTDPGAKWSLFGEDQTDKVSTGKNMQEAHIGFAVASPILLLAGGERQITLTIQLNDVPEEEIYSGDISGLVQVLLSGEKEWVTPSSFTAYIYSTRLSPPLDTFFSGTLVITIQLATSDASVVPFKNAVLSGNFSTAWPVLKLELTKAAYFYEKVYNFQVSSANIEVSVKGVKDLVLQNDISQLNAAQPFEPFGPAPLIGSDLYIGSSEIFQKKLSSFNINILWNGVPADDQGNLGTNYLSWFENTTSSSNIIFTASLSMLYKGKWITFENQNNLPGGDYFLFNINNAKNPNQITVLNNNVSSAFDEVTYDRQLTEPPLVSLDNRTKSGFIRLEISGPEAGYPFKAFGQNEFSGIYTRRAIEIATGNTLAKLPNPPYTPLIKTLSVDYVSGQDVDLEDGNSPDQFFYIEPFGSAKVPTGNPYLFPQFRDESKLPLPKLKSVLYRGNMYMGISDLVPPQNLSILFQVAEGSASPNADIQDEDISWFYLANNQWTPLSAMEIISNTTRGLQTSGIITFSIGAEATKDNTLMPSGLHWLRASITKDPAQVNQIIDTRTQALEATYMLSADNQLADLHLAQPMPALSIKEMVVRMSSVKSVTQPYISFGGQKDEADTVFYTRISERLRHKKRALGLWDFEHLILSGFPEIFKVKCLTHTDETTDLAPGTVSAVVVPNLINKNSINPLQPKVNLLTLQNIEAYLSNYLPLFVTFKANNPVYEPLLVDFKVGFMPGKDAGFYGKLLNEEIKKFLSPWAYEEGQDITFGGKIFKSDIIIFIESRPYVDFVNNFNLYHVFDGQDADGPGIGTMRIGTDFIIGEDFFPAIGDMAIGEDFVVGRDTEVATASGPRSILVSAENHRITVLKPGQYQCVGTGSLGIGFMIIEENFIVS